MHQRPIAVDTAAARTEDLPHFRLDGMIDLLPPPARLVQRLPWDTLRKAIAHPTESRLLEMARKPLVPISCSNGLKLCARFTGMKPLPDT